MESDEKRLAPFRNLAIALPEMTPGTQGGGIAPVTTQGTTSGTQGAAPATQDATHGFTQVVLELKTALQELNTVLAGLKDLLQASQPGTQDN